MKYRVEDKYYVTDADIAMLSGRLSSVMKLDPHQKGESYGIRSLYLDDIWDTGMDEKSAGVDSREKFRVRIYDGSPDTIHLEMKGKLHGYTYKDSCTVTREETEALIDGTLAGQMDGRRLLNRVRLMKHTSRLVPKVIIDYERTAYVYPAGNVRITFDRNIAAGRSKMDFFEPQMPGMVPLLPAGLHIMEVKYDEFLPDFIKMQLEIGKLRRSAFSKYYLGRLAVAGRIGREY